MQVFEPKLKYLFDPVARTLGTRKGASPVLEIPKVLATQPADNAVAAVHRPLRGRLRQLHSRAMMTASAPSVAHLLSGPSPGN